MGSYVSRSNETINKSPNSKSWPPQNSRSGETERCTGGFPANTFSPSTSGRAPPENPARDDRYRTEMRDQGIPKASNYHKKYSDYKDGETWGESAVSQYKGHLDSEEAPSRAERSNTPQESYVGQPLGTPAYHKKASEYAANAQAAYKR